MPAVAASGGLPNRLGKYEIMMSLAAGGMARIYIGRTTGIGSFERHVVLKVITPERANDTIAVQMFLDEARLAASLNHQNVAQVFEVGEDLGIHYLAMEYVHGQDLRALLAKAGSQGTRIPLELALTVVAGGAAGLNHAHERRGGDGVPLGIVHRDVSPSNIMIGYDGSVKLLDFGIAKATARSVETQSGIIKGKFAYMAPEQCRGRDVDRRSDVFSLGIILYEISTQHRCFRADSDFDTMHRIVTGDVVRPTRLVQGYPQALEAIVMKALAVDQNQRYQSAGALLEAIESFAVSSRMSLSTMSLGRFMRDMFGDMTEPWLNAAAHRSSQHPLQPKESTISNTGGTGSDSHEQRVREHQPTTPVERPSVSPAQMQAARTTLDLPRGESQSDADPQAAEWNAKSYPMMQPPSPESGERAVPSVRTSSPALPTVPASASMGAQPSSQPHAHPTSPSLATVSPAASQPIAAQPSVPPGKLTPGAGSGSGPAHKAVPVGNSMPIASTRHGYASGGGAMTNNDLSYPRYEPPADAQDDLRLKPNRRPLFIGLGIASVGLIVFLIMAIGGGGSEDDDESKPTPIKMEEGREGTDPTTTQPSIAMEADDPHSISVNVSSNPEGADVLLAGKVIGTTPLKTKIKRGTGLSMITVHKARYIDVTKQIDLRGDFASELTLKKEDETTTTTTTTDPKTGSGSDVKMGTDPKSGTDTKSGADTKASTDTKTGTKSGTDTKTTTKTGTDTKSGTVTKTGTNTKTGTKSGTKTGSRTGTTTPKKPACQQPQHYDAFDSRPLCK